MPKRFVAQFCRARTVVGFAGCLLLAQPGGGALADGFRVRDVSSELVDDVYHVSASVDYELTGPVLEALQSGVRIVIEVPIEVFQPRDWIWDVSVASLSQRYRLEYHALTRQYLVTNLNSDVQSTYPTRHAALGALGRVVDLPILDRRLLKVGEHYMARLRVRLALEELPSPLRLWAYMSGDWRLASDWYVWRLQ
ncbi:MAG: DUF4390 domain-containing protein [Gammaproteobacteria bacterium]|nr:DUF4390 domain-containing protein [Gammaproteobacteria bacterium]NIR98381.1 DUF4390 domain-containing protein [Gammaproteobacteria bacterium]NIT64135.1 DUF4390 domain-containing protein [Gammaproteobacteria bacterium]NIV21072.1 DUF4390 domain-containing protein [Gammaproteobacteria bacterium]NIY32715.1 DUF4390 domain-containing protein [Gammaproteobacteria bacterium]